jgi:hypothetical protein
MITRGFRDPILIQAIIGQVRLGQISHNATVLELQNWIFIAAAIAFFIAVLLGMMFS